MLDFLISFSFTEKVKCFPYDFELAVLAVMK